jgi:hypothetical protein
MAIAGYFSYIGAYEELGEASADCQAVKNLRSGQCHRMSVERGTGI